MQRREFITYLTGSGLMLATGNKLLADDAFDNIPKPSVKKLERSAEYWRDKVSEDAHYILFEEGTERAFTSPLNDLKEEGTFVCAACNLPLFDSKTKYDSGTGWPSFYTSFKGHVGTKLDLKLFWPRTEYHCARCGGHQGHVFDDGPKPTGLRYCNNGLALKFIPKGEEMPELRG